MRKLVLILVLTFSFAFAKAQNIQLHYDFGENRKCATTTIEMFKPDKYGSSFFFVDMMHSDKGVIDAYTEISRELKFWEGPISAHVEYNGGLNSSMLFNNAYLIGATYSLNASDFSKGISFTASYKNIQGNNSPHNYQFTAVWYVNMLDNKLSFTGFADFWSEEHTVSNDGFVADFQGADFVFLTEPQLWYNVNEKFSVGTEIEISSNFAGNAGFMVNPTAAVKYNF